MITPNRTPAKDPPPHDPPLPDDPRPEIPDPRGPKFPNEDPRLPHVEDPPPIPESPGGPAKF